MEVVFVRWASSGIGASMLASIRALGVTNVVSSQENTITASVSTTTNVNQPKRPSTLIRGMVSTRAQQIRFLQVVLLVKLKISVLWERRDTRKNVCRKSRCPVKHVQQSR